MTYDDSELFTVFTKSLTQDMAAKRPGVNKEHERIGH